MTYRIVEVTQGVSTQLEQLGSKYKFWYRSGGRRTLFKEGRPNTGENWAEKASCEIARILGLPHADYEPARCGDRHGVIRTETRAEEKVFSELSFARRALMDALYDHTHGGQAAAWAKGQ